MGVNRKMSPELAAEKGVILGEPYTPPGRSATFDVPSYDDIADLQMLFKRFANTAAGFTEAGGGAFVDKQGNFSVGKNDCYKTYLVSASTLVSVSVADPGSLQEGDKFTVIQGSTGKVEINGVNVVGLSQTAGQYQGIVATVHDGKWWCVPFGTSGGGATGPIPIFPLSETTTIDVTQAGGLLAMDSSDKNLQVIVPGSASIPVGSAYVVSNVGSSSKNRVTVAPGAGVTILNRQSAVIDRFRLATVVKVSEGTAQAPNDVWLLNAGGGGGGSSAPLPPTITACFGLSGGAFISWLAPEDDGGSPITAYLVDQSLDQLDWSNAGSTDKDGRSIVVNSLEPGKTYYLRVKAVNANGVSDPSTVQDATPTDKYNDATGGEVSTYTQDGRIFRLHTFKNDGTFVVGNSVAPFQIFIVAGGGNNGGDGGTGGYASGGGGGGGIFNSAVKLDIGQIPVFVGKGGANAGYGGDSSLGAIKCGGGGIGGRAGGPGSGRPGSGGGGNGYGGGSMAGPGVNPTCGQGANVTFLGKVYSACGARSAPYGDFSVYQNRGVGGDVGDCYCEQSYRPFFPGSDGIVMISYEISPNNDADGGVETYYSKDGKFFKVHTFKWNDGNEELIVKNASSPFQVLLFGGGGGGGEASYTAGGGGAGGFILDNSMDLEAKTYPISVGRGATAVGQAGSDTTAFGLTAKGGGPGGVFRGGGGTTGGTGGSGGGGGGGGLKPGAGGAGGGGAPVIGQGNSGGQGATNKGPYENSSIGIGGGGGGAGGPAYPGGPEQGDGGTAPGPGKVFTITGSAVTAGAGGPAGGGTGGSWDGSNGVVIVAYEVGELPAETVLMDQIAWQELSSREAAES